MGCLWTHQHGPEARLGGAEVGRGPSLPRLVEGAIPSLTPLRLGCCHRCAWNLRPPSKAQVEIWFPMEAGRGAGGRRTCQEAPRASTGTHRISRGSGGTGKLLSKAAPVGC